MPNVHKSGLYKLAQAAVLLSCSALIATPTLAEPYGPSPDNPKQGGSLNLGSLVEPPALDPFHQAADARIRVSVLVYQGLLYEDASGVAQPLLAEQYEVSEDGLRYTFKIRSGVKFHTGATMTPADVKYSYDYIRDPANGSPGAKDFATIEAINLLADDTVEFVLSEPNAALPMTLTNKYGAVVPQGTFDDPAAKAALNQTSVGTGPFKLAAFETNSYLRLVRFEDYWQAGLPYLDEVTFLFMPNSAAMLVGLQNQRIDLALLDRPQDIDRIEKLEHIEVKRWPSLNQKALDLDSAYGPLQDVRVRQAISLAIDKQKIMEAAFSGYGQVIGTMVAGMQETWGVPLSELPMQGPDLAAARQLMADAGHSDGLEMDLITIIGYDWMDPAALTLAQQLSEIGITLNIQKLELGVWIQNFRSRQMKLTFNDWATSPDPNLLFYRHFHKQPEGADFRNWNNDKASALLDQGRTESDPDKRRAIYLDFQRELATTVPTIMLFSADWISAANRKVKNYQHHPTGWYFGLVKTYLD